MKTRVAATVVLLEAAHVDEDCSTEELAHIHETLRCKFGLTAECAEELIASGNRERENSVDLWQFTNRINQEFSKAEKLEVMEDVWRLVHLDEILEMHEDHYAHKLANLLRLTHDEMIGAKIRARSELKQYQSPGERA